MSLVNFFFVEILKQIWENDVKNDQKANLMVGLKNIEKEGLYYERCYVGDNIEKCLQDASEAGGYELRAIPYDPLVLDLNHNGVIDTANIENGAYFDGGNDDFSEKMAWVSGGDGLLCIDKNNDKLIDSSELFGNSDVYGFDAQKFCG